MIVKRLQFKHLEFTRAQTLPGSLTFSFTCRMVPNCSILP